MANDPDSPQLGESKGNQAARIGASALGAIPVLGPIIQATVTETIPNIRLERIEAYLRHLERRIDEATLAEQLQHERQLDLFEEGMWQSARAVGDERKERIANLVVVGLTEPEKEAARVRHWLRILDLLGDEDIACLWEEYIWVIHHDHVTDDPSIQRRHAMQDIVVSRRQYLASLGLMGLLNVFGGVEVGGVTENGIEFLGHLGLIEAGDDL